MTRDMLANSHRAKFALHSQRHLQSASMLSSAAPDWFGDRHWSRRAWLRFGTLAPLTGMPAPQRLFSAVDAPTAAGFGRAKSVVLVFANGGQSQLDMWDMKPDAPLDLRGAFRPIGTRI